MEEIIQVIVNNGLGIGSFFALLYFMDKYLSKISKTNEEISSTLISVKDSLEDLTNRVNAIENKTKSKAEKKESNN